MEGIIWYNSDEKGFIRKGDNKSLPLVAEPIFPNTLLGTCQESNVLTVKIILKVC